MASRNIMLAVVGAGACDDATAALAARVGREVARHGCSLVTGGRGGVMEAASRGAAEGGGLVIGILPGTSTAEANPHVQVPVVTGLGEARNVIIARTAHGVIAVGGEYGTLSEIAFALKFNKPVASLGSWEIDPSIMRASSPEEAVEWVLARLG